MTDKPDGKRWGWGAWGLIGVAVSTIPFVAGCIGDAAVPTVCSTKLPGTRYEIYLFGPDKSGYFYSIESPDGDCGMRGLGHIAIDESIPPRLETLGKGVFRITWGRAPTTAFATIDTTKRLIVADSNNANPSNTPFETPRYLRPEYRHIGERK
jgi:hypothetical protein